MSLVRFCGMVLSLLLFVGYMKCPVTAQAQSGPTVAAFVGVQDGGRTAIYSQDGINWSNSPGVLPYSTEWDRVLYGAGNYVAIAQNSTDTALSATGTNWVAGGSLPNSDNWLGFAYGNGTFAVAAYGSSVGAYSTNGGTNWLTSTMPAEDWRAMAFGNGLFVAIPAYSTNAVYSGNGIFWTNAVTGLPDAGYWQALTYGNGIFVAIVGGANESAYSTDGKNWNAGNGLPDGDWAGLTFGNGVFVATADYSTLLAFSTNGIDWEEGIMPVDDDWFTCTYGSGVFATLSQGTGHSAYSANGVSWTVNSSSLYSDDWYGLGAYQPESVITTQPVSQAVAAGVNVTFTVGVAGSSPTYQWYSNGLSLANGGPISGATTSALTLSSVTGSNAANYSVAVTTSLGSSASLAAALLVTPPTQVALFAAAANNNSNAIYSLDGSNWLASPTGMPSDDQWQRVVYGLGMYVAIPWLGENSAFSYDGINWMASPAFMPAAVDWADLAFGNGEPLSPFNSADPARPTVPTASLGPAFPCPAAMTGTRSATAMEFSWPSRPTTMPRLTAATEFIGPTIPIRFPFQVIGRADRE